jgi:uncharacterized RDD family membrane protein YckC
MNRAGVGIRAVEGFVDLIVCYGILWVVGFLTGNTNGGNVHLSGAPAFVGFALCLVYFVLLEALTGATIGKYVTNLRVVRDRDGGPIGWGAAVVRNLLRIIDGIVLYLIGFIVVCATKKHQRLGDLVAGTIVIRRSAVGAPITRPDTVEH